MSLKKYFIAVGSFLILLFSLSFAHAGEAFKDYSPGDVKSALGEGKTVVVDYYASWCGTCRTQGRVMDKILNENPDIKKAMVFFKVDWDKYKSSAISTDHNIPRRSTQIVLRGNEELGRAIAKTSESDLKSLLETGL